ncbi:MAG: tetratricopeptide repeat protein [Desulfobacterota bacterium]|nr:tetratricopeptide repeat protein [Thermodesulfobacteriota bacterium]
MKKETALLAIFIAFLVGFITGAVAAILRGTKGLEKLAAPPSPQQSLPASPEPDLTAMNLRIKALQNLLEKDPKNLEALEELGNLYFDTGQPREAIDAYSRYLAIQPDNPNVRTDMGIMYRALGDFDRAISEFRRAAQSDPKHLNSRYNIGIVLLHDKNDVSGAIRAWEEYLKVDPNSERANRLKAQIEKMKRMGKDVPKVSK